MLAVESQCSHFSPCTRLPARSHWAYSTDQILWGGGIPCGSDHTFAVLLVLAYIDAASCGCCKDDD